MAQIEHLLRCQLNAYSDAWRQRHQEAMEVWDLEAVLRSGLAIYRSIETLVLHRNEQIDFGCRSFDLHEMVSFQKLYATWLAASRELLGDISRCEQAGFVVEAAAPFREACRDAAEIAARDFTEELASIRELEEGRGLSLQEVRDELRRHHFGQRP